MNYRKEIVEIIQRMSGRYTAHQIFCDWTKTCSLSIANAGVMIHDAVYEAREQQFREVMGKYIPAERTMFAEMMGMLSMEMEQGIDDILGAIYMEGGMGSGQIGQFFTPFHISYATAKMNIEKIIEESDSGKITMYEPSAGAGGMVLALAKALDEKGIDYQKSMEVVAQDLDWNTVHLCHLQLSLYGINATVIQGDSLSGESNIGKVDRMRKLITPRKAGMLI